MKFDAQKFIIGRMNCCSVLLPGALLSWLLMDEAGPFVRQIDEGEPHR